MAPVKLLVIREARGGVMRQRCCLCGEPIEPGDDDAVELHGGVIVHEDCLREHDEEQALQCSAAEIARQRAARKRRLA